MIHFGNPRLPLEVWALVVLAHIMDDSSDTFSHKKGITVKANWLDITLRYAPYKNKLKKLKMPLNGWVN